MLRDAQGNRLFRRVEVKIFFPNGVMPVKKMPHRAEAHKGFGSDAIDKILMDVTDQLETLYPWWDFRLVELAPEGRTAKYNFTFAGYRAGTPVALMDPNHTIAIQDSQVLGGAEVREAEAELQKAGIAPLTQVQEEQS